VHLPATAARELSDPGVAINVLNTTAAYDGHHPAAASGDG
jgi:hypothetical protein